MDATAFDELGFALLPELLSADECSGIEPVLLAEGAVGGSRCLLSLAWCAALARRLRAHPALRELLPSTHVAVQCTYFEKSAARNWLVGLHQDLSIPIAVRTRVADRRLRRHPTTATTTGPGSTGCAWDGASTFTSPARRAKAASAAASLAACTVSRGWPRCTS
jgi:hypothetical protein